MKNPTRPPKNPPPYSPETPPDLVMHHLQPRWRGLRRSPRREGRGQRTAHGLRGPRASGETWDVGNTVTLTCENQISSGMHIHMIIYEYIYIYMIIYEYI